MVFAAEWIYASENETCENTCLEYTHLLGADSWTLCKADESRIVAAEMWYLMRMHNISWKQKVINASTLCELIKERQLWGKP